MRAYERAWLHFDRCEIGYLPIPPDEKEVDLLTVVFENLHMMLLVICDEDLKGILTDVCKKVGIKLTVRKRLSAVNRAQKELLAQIM